MHTHVLSSVVDDLERRGGLAARLEELTVGDAAVLVECERPSDATTVAGLAHRPSSALDADGWSGKDSTDLLEWLVDEIERPFDALEPEERLARVVGVAIVNAVSTPYVAWENGDPMSLLSPSVETVVTIGLFKPAFRKFDDVEVRVVERELPDEVSTPDSVDLRSYTPEETTAAMDGAEVVFVTGSTLIYGGIDRYLETAPPEATVVLVGATASLLPGPLFDAGVDIVAGADVVDLSRARAAVGRGVCGTGLHDNGVRKVYATRRHPSTIDLEIDGD
ncbi:Rossmann-like domain-containing protein [Natronobacterium gregoryi]|nr:DUF364 domain-containing protein [Natronobacterium gregoryi]